VQYLLLFYELKLANKLHVGSATSFCKYKILAKIFINGYPLFALELKN